MKRPEDVFTEFLGIIVPFTQQCLEKYGEFAPCGATCGLTDEIALAAPHVGDGPAPGPELVALLRDGFADGARSRYRATALAYDAYFAPPGATDKSDAIAVELDHVDGLSVVVYYPYTLVNRRFRGRACTLGDPVTMEGAGAIFGPQPEG
ncbi:MAG: hypothetical protein ACKVVT_00780 [Dehalococcoidia bacterium]